MSSLVGEGNDVLRSDVAAMCETDGRAGSDTGGGCCGATEVRVEAGAPATVNSGRRSSSFGLNFA